MQFNLNIYSFHVKHLALSRLQRLIEIWSRIAGKLSNRGFDVYKSSAIVYNGCNHLIIGAVADHKAEFVQRIPLEEKDVWLEIGAESKLWM